VSIKKAYVAVSALILALSTVAWALAAARLGQGNADQLADGFLFQDAQTFSNAQFPAAHTQLLKWPLFWLLAAAHNARWAYLSMTVVLALLTVGLLVYVVYRINRRPLVFATICLGLASILALVPAQVHGSVTAPLSLAMITGRNVEYLVYIASLILFVRASAIASWQWGAGVALLGLLLASDHFFLPVTLAGGFGLWLISYVWRQPQLSGLARRWLLGSGVAWLVSYILLWIVRQFTYVVGPSSSPYGWIDGINNVHQAMAGLFKGLLLNFGITTGPGKLTVITAAANAIIALATVYAVAKVITHIRAAPQKLSRAQLLTIMLLLSSVVAVVLYVGTNHPYVADARYLSLLFFTGAIAVATYARQIRLIPKYYYIAGVVLAVATIIGTAGAWQHTNQILAHNELLRRNAVIAHALSKHPEQILVGDYWRVLPIKELTKNASQQIMPLTSCAQPRQVLTSKAWNKRLQTHSFAYLLPVLPAGTPFGTCTLQFVEFLYGPPSSMLVVAGTARSPAELLLFYNDGAADNQGRTILPPKPVLGAPTEGEAMPTGSMMTPLDAPSWSSEPPSVIR
jgi:hypothetical protein